MSLAKLRKRVDYWRGLREKGLEPSPVAEIPIEDAEALCDLADRSRALVESLDDEDAGTHRGRMRTAELAGEVDAALARLDGEDTDGH